MPACAKSVITGSALALFVVLAQSPLAMAKGAAAVEEQPLDLAARAAAQGAIDRGLAFLLPAQSTDGAWQAFDRPHPAITALVVKALTQDRSHGPDHPAVRRGLDFVLRYAQPDGGVYVEGEGMCNYHTSVALMALAAAKNPAHDKAIRGAQRFLKKLQWDSGEGHETSSPWYGGAGYGRHKRPDLSNTQLMLEALHQSGLDAEDPTFKKAMVFISRCQMLGESNDQTFAAESADGGFVYTAANGGESKAGTEIAKTDSGSGKPRLRSYGTMTYAGFKSMLYAGLNRDDPRVKAAMAWIRKHYTLDRNPNMPGESAKQGLYYYYYVFARALAAWDEETIADANGVPHRWREELIRKLCALQRADGSWVNESDRWYEGNPHLVTAYAILALQTALGS